MPRSPSGIEKTVPSWSGWFSVSSPMRQSTLAVSVIHLDMIRS
jgi:hypothetical protein